MAPLVLEGETLGQRHRHYNQLVAAAVADQATELLPLNYDDLDVDNLLKIDVACSRRNVEYILDVLQSDDMLYVSRAIKQSTWLITDDQYVHIINPENLNNVLFPKITSKAKNKLLLAIRLNLRNESRVDDFFKYYINDKTVQKWLPNCSSTMIEKYFSEHAHRITADVFKRLCETSISFLKILLKIRTWRYIGHQLEESKILINKYADEYIELMKNLNKNDMPTFGIRATRQIMLHCPDKVINNFEKFANHIHLPTFVKYLKKKEDIRDFLVKQSENKEMNNWIKYDNVKHFVKHLPIETRFEFVKRIFIDKETSKPKKQSSGFLEYGYTPCSADYKCEVSSTNASIYRWYRFATFDAAFVDLKKLVRVESSPAERNAILTVLINCARRNPAHVKTLLQFYREKHINEPFKFKIQFINTFVSLIDTHKFDVTTWTILNDIFSSMEVYVESEHSIPYCIKAIIVYKLLHNEDIPQIIEKKHTFDTFKEYCNNKLGEKYSEVLFTYLYNLEMNKLNKQTINNEIEMTMAFDLLRNILTLLKVWKKNITDYPMIGDKIKYIIKIKKEKLLMNNLSFIYNVEKKWRRELFEDSLLLNQGDETCVHALKHDPGLLLRFHTEVAVMCSNDTISLKHSLCRLRIYWPQSLAQTWTKIYLEGLSKPTGHKATIEGMCILLPRKQMQSLLAKYAPVETKIDWSNTDTTLLGVQKNIAKRMQLIRPSINLEAVLPYAKKDYLQYALPSLNAVLYNMSAKQVLTLIPILLDSPVSLKKHILRAAYTKLTFTEIKELVENIWKNTKNSSIKTVLFKETFILLKKAKKHSTVNELWQLLNMFIDNLTPDENRVIYDTLGKADDVHMAVRAQFFMKSYKYLSSLPAKANCEPILRNLSYQALKIMNLLDPSFVESALLKSIPEFISLMTDETDDRNTDLNTDVSILASYIMDSETAEIQYTRYEKYLIPILDNCLRNWKYSKKGVYVVRNNCLVLFMELLHKIKANALRKSDLNIKMFQDIGKRLATLPLQENYRVFTYWTIATLFVESYMNYMKGRPKSDVQSAMDLEPKDIIELTTDKNTRKIEQEDMEKWDEICCAVAPLFGRSCLNFIKNGNLFQLPSLTKFLTKSLRDVFDQLEFSNIARLHVSKNMLDSDIIVTYLVVLKITHSTTYYERDEVLTKMRHEIYALIRSHPSPDVKIYYLETQYSYPQECEETVSY